MVVQKMTLFWHGAHWGNVDYGHDFQRDRNSHYCYVCHGTWPSNDGVITKYHVCGSCGKRDLLVTSLRLMLWRFWLRWIMRLFIFDTWKGLSVHSGCRLLAKTCYPCPGSTSSNTGKKGDTCGSKNESMRANKLSPVELWAITSVCSGMLYAYYN